MEGDLVLVDSHWSELRVYSTLKRIRSIIRDCSIKFNNEHWRFDNSQQIINSLWFWLEPTRLMTTFNVSTVVLGAAFRLSWVVANTRLWFLFIDLIILSSSAILPTLLECYSRFAHVSITRGRDIFPRKIENIKLARFLCWWWNDTNNGETHVHTIIHSSSLTHWLKCAEKQWRKSSMWFIRFDWWRKYIIFMHTLIKQQQQQQQWKSSDAECCRLIRSRESNGRRKMWLVISKLYNHMHSLSLSINWRFLIRVVHMSSHCVE
jgi:hypothetical protein